MHLAHQKADYLSVTSDCVRAMLASTPPPSTALWATAGEDEAIRALHKDGHLTLPRFDAHSTSDRNGTTLPDIHLGAIRLYDRGIITLATHPDTDAPQFTDTHATWVWNDHHGESKGLRLQRWRTLSYLPYQVGHFNLTPETTMSGPLMVAVLAWHHSHTGAVRLDLHLNPANPVVTRPSEQHFSRLNPRGSDWTLTLVEHHHDGTTHERAITADTAAETVEVTRYDFDHADADDFSLALRRNAHPHRQPGRTDLLHPAHEARLLHALTTRIAPTLFDGATALSVDLNTWLLHPHTTAPRAGVSVPLDVQDALTVLGAPTSTSTGVLTDPAAAIDWATTHAHITVGCKGTSNGDTIWRYRHTITLTADGAMTIEPPKTATVRARCDADHMLAALNGHTPTCVTLARILDGTDAASIRGTLSRLRISNPATADRLEAAHRVCRWLREPVTWWLPEHRR
jgi:hypothetical protein